MIISHETKLKEINDAPEFVKAKNALISGGDFFTGEKAEFSLDKLQESHPSYNPDDIIYGLNSLKENISRTNNYIMNVYSDEQIQKEPRLEAVKLFFLKPRVKKNDTAIILLAGGAYGAVCTMLESLPVAAKLSEMGFTCFCLNYRVAAPEDMLNGLLPKPIDDIAAAWNFIQKNEDLFDVDINNYAVCGFSAGGHLASLWGTEHVGARHYSIPQAKANILAYPLVTMATVPDSPIKKYLCTGMFGENYSSQDISKYDVSLHIDKKYPKTYIVRALDDSTVSVKDAELLKNSMNAFGIKCTVESGETGNHGFGLGSATRLAGWVERAVLIL